MEKLQIVPVQQGVQPQYVEMRVPLYSYGCEKKVKKALLSLKARIYSVHVDYGMQKVTVWGICNRDNVLATVKKKRKGACFWDQAAALTATEEVTAPENAGELQASASKGFRSGKAAFYRRFRMRRSWKSLLPLALVLSH